MGLAETLAKAAARRGLQTPGVHHPEVLAQLEYPLELDLKNEALQSFWREHRLPGSPEPVVPAPLPRAYRTNSKRRALLRSGRVNLTFPGLEHGGSAVAPSLLDDPSHSKVYTMVHTRLARPHLKALAAAMNHVIVRGGAGALAVILNVRVFNAAVVRAAKLLGEDLRRAELGVGAAFLYLDPTASDYYLEARRPAGVLSFKRLFGADWLQAEVEDQRLRFPVTAFSQVNTPMVPLLVRKVAELLGPLQGRSLLDLYCGYGLFALTVGRDAVRVTGIDAAGPAIEAARGNALHLGFGTRACFRAGSIDAAYLDRQPAPSEEPERVLLDPPRQGTAPGVAAAVAWRGPERVVHLCCGADEIPREVAAWTDAGFRLERAVPLDLFAGTASLETALLLAPADSGRGSLSPATSDRAASQPGRRFR